MNFHSFRHALTAVFLALAGSLMLAGCGGGGAAADTQGSVMRILPENATAYAGIPFTVTVVGGRMPYTMSSSEPSLFPVPQTLNSSTFTVIPANPGVVDTGLQPGELPVRSVILQARDTTALLTVANYKVGQNFLTGYGLSLTPTNCPAGGGAVAVVACAGGTTAVQMQATFAGNLHGDQQFRLEVVRGPFAMRHPVTGQVSNSITVTSDHSGTVMGLIEVAPNVGTTVAVIRIVHIPTGVYADQAFVITGSDLPPNEPLTPVPNSFTFTGALNTECGTGFGDFYVFGGVGPFTAVSTDPSVFVTPSQASGNPARFTVAASNPTICVDNATVIVTDSLGRRATVSVTTKVGTQSPPAPVPITISPASITINSCGASGSVSVVGGNGPLSATSTAPTVTTIISGNTITVTRRATGDGATVFPTSVTISVTDGSQIATLTATVPANCP